MSSTQYRMMANDPPSRHFLHLQTRPQIIPKNPPNIHQKKKKKKTWNACPLEKKSSNNHVASHTIPVISSIISNFGEL
jgi:hypothetical protein